MIYSSVREQALVNPSSYGFQLLVADEHKTDRLSPIAACRPFPEGRSAKAYVFLCLRMLHCTAQHTAQTGWNDPPHARVPVGPRVDGGHDGERIRRGNRSSG